MKNFPVIKDNKEYWVSRSVAVIAFLIAKDKYNNAYVLTVKRGKGTPDPEFVGAYCAPCGYLDYDETTVEAAARELKEETGIELSTSLFKLVEVNSDPASDKRQNVCFEYLIAPNLSELSKEELEKRFTIANAEEEEVSSIQFINVKELDKYKWAFNHDSLIKELIDKYGYLITNMYAEPSTRKIYKDFNDSKYLKESFKQFKNSFYDSL